MKKPILGVVGLTLAASLFFIGVKGEEVTPEMLSAMPCETATASTEEFVPTPMNGLALYQIMEEKGNDYYGDYYLEVEENPVFVEKGTDAESIEEVSEASTEETGVGCEDSEPTEEVGAENEFPMYSVDSVTLHTDLQRFAYDTLSGFGIEWYYELFLCQMYQESRFNQGEVSSHNCYGICQLKLDHHEEFKAESGVWSGADLINDPYANIYVGAYLMSKYIHQCSDVDVAIGAYYTGVVGDVNWQYVSDVKQWLPTLRRIN